MAKTTRRVLLAVALILSMGQYAAAEVSKEELKSISTPDSVKTSIGTLKFFDGVPTDDTVKKVYPLAKAKNPPSKDLSWGSRSSSPVNEFKERSAK